MPSTQFARKSIYGIKPSPIVKPLQPMRPVPPIYDGLGQKPGPQPFAPMPGSDGIYAGPEVYQQPNGPVGAAVPTDPSQPAGIGSALPGNPLPMPVNPSPSAPPDNASSPIGTQPSMPIGAPTEFDPLTSWLMNINQFMPLNTVQPQTGMMSLANIKPGIV